MEELEKSIDSKSVTDLFLEDVFDSPAGAEIHYIQFTKWLTTLSYDVSFRVKIVCIIAILLAYVNENPM